jgi:hypothetical protein
MSARTAVRLEASAAVGFGFTGWCGLCTGTGSCDLILSADGFATATFYIVTAVPNVVGATQALATAAITRAGLVLGTVTVQSSSAVARGNVISESPAAGTNVASGSAVSLVVSSGCSSCDGGGGSLSLVELLWTLCLGLRRARPQLL